MWSQKLRLFHLKLKKKCQKNHLSLAWPRRQSVCARAQYRLSPGLSQLIESNRACSYWISVSDIDTLGVETVGPEIE